MGAVRRSFLQCPQENTNDGVSSFKRNFNTGAFL